MPICQGVVVLFVTSRGPIDLAVSMIAITHPWNGPWNQSLNFIFTYQKWNPQKLHKRLAIGWVRLGFNFSPKISRENCWIFRRWHRFFFSLEDFHGNRSAFLTVCLFWWVATNDKQKDLVEQGTWPIKWKWMAQRVNINQHIGAAPFRNFSDLSWWPKC